ncbi:bifunctional phosphoribosyl-AMP cyclohydrolase/phosphoribosyl-ATP diphosphatase [Aliifodinibius salipaludis]|uniref:Histidine biosynthesis bifunctional protein HisIE n=1 Tax=Fodinibius salipaludis TaxID=2032627 RepID=A0A2A2G7E3_9BACT|nr:bifunctional phosphoribosyl-AMP cyclohydrolase/phosphoribosyl-ATP diphosphatase HisIE [Aliifodinibius salipaludis]PAU93676.1 bifunctional phosphoribosyl-AMP cyclohydrolase/phosphoribosyl-ATP diphosphatase [Aliifodinibius salipaludis]
MIDINALDFEKGNGLIPAIIQDADSFQVLMLGYMNKEALQKTLDEERVTFFSRSKQRLWTKGETSGNYLDVVDLQKDCDDDTLLILTKPHGPTCHTGEQSCFYRKDFKPQKNLNFLNNLEELIISRKEQMPEGSYTTSLFEDGIDKIAQKVGEEAVETVIEAKNEDHNLVDEVSDLIYHLLVLLVAKGVPLQTIVQNLEERHGK